MPHRALLVIFCLIVQTCAIAQESSSVNIKRIVIDAGHGGRDPGTVSPDGRVKEKDITLSVALKLGNLIKKNHPSIEIVYTRKTDVAVALSKRSEIANKSKADLFISIHVNAARSRAASGSETFVMGTDKTSSNLEVSMLENSVILLEGDDYHTKYEGFNPNDPESYIVFTLLQNAYLEQSLLMASLVQKHFGKGPIKVNRGIKQAPFLVLWKTSMPSVLIELGFISNNNDYKVLSSTKNHDRFAELIYTAFEEFRSQYDKGYNNLDYVTPSSANSDVKPTYQDTHYRVQIFSGKNIIPATSREFKGETNIGQIQSGTIYKYTVGKYSTLEEAERAKTRIRKKFPKAFIIKVSNGKIVPL